MAEIIKHGKEHKIATCMYCECVFSYRLIEVHKNRGHHYTHCPDCLRLTLIETTPEENTTQED